MWIFAIIVIIITAIVVAYVVDKPKIEKQKKVQLNKEYEYMSDNEIISSAEYTYQNSNYQNNISYNNGVFFKYVVDDKNKNIHIIGKQLAMCIPFNKVIGCEVLSDSKTVGSVKRSVVGALIAGGTGAIVGALSTQPHIMSYKIVIYRDNIQSPTIELPLITQKISTQDKDFVSAEAFAQKVLASIKVIVHKNGNDNKQSSILQSDSSDYNVVFASPIGDKINAIKYIREIKQMNLAEANHYVDEPNAVIYSSINLEFANDVVNTLKMQGIFAKITDCNASTPVQNEEKERVETTVQSTSTVADEIEKLHQLKEKGIITEDEFNQQKKKLLDI